MTRAQRPRVLIVEDVEPLRRTLARVLAPSFQVTAATNGAEAVAVLEKESFDAVVTDLEMPELGGDGLVDWLERNRPALAARVVVVTGGAKQPEREAWLEAFDGQRVLRKPCRAEEIVAALRRVLSGGAS